MFVAVFAVRFAMAMIGLDHGMATYPPAAKMDSGMEMVVGTATATETANGSDES